MPSTGNVARILYKEIVDGDLRKIHANSNDTDSGGGARDFRFGSYGRLIHVIQKMFPHTEKIKRRREGQNQQIDLFKGSFYWHDKLNKVHSKEVFFEPPTDARPSEGRIARVHEYECFDTSLIPTSGVNNRILLLFIQLADGSVWPYYAEEISIKTPGNWDPIVAKILIGCLDAIRPDKKAVIGYSDLVSGDMYCNGK